MWHPHRWLTDGLCDHNPDNSSSSPSQDKDDEYRRYFSYPEPDRAPKGFMRPVTCHSMGRNCFFIFLAFHGYNWKWRELYLGLRSWFMRVGCSCASVWKKGYCLYYDSSLRINHLFQHGNSMDHLSAGPILMYADYTPLATPHQVWNTGCNASCLKTGQVDYTIL